VQKRVPSGRKGLFVSAFFSAGLCCRTAKSGQNRTRTARIKRVPQLPPLRGKPIFCGGFRPPSQEIVENAEADLQTLRILHIFTPKAGNFAKRQENLETFS
jgi:hypothetical protein